MNMIFLQDQDDNYTTGKSPNNILDDKIIEIHEHRFVW